MVSASLTLDHVMDLRAAAPLREALLGRRGGAVAVDASAVERLGGLCLQVLLSARQTWAGDGHAFSITGQSEGFREAIRLLGASSRLDEI